MFASTSHGGGLEKCTRQKGETFIAQGEYKTTTTRQVGYDYFGVTRRGALGLHIYSLYTNLQGIRKWRLRTGYICIRPEWYFLQLTSPTVTYSHILKNMYLNRCVPTPTSGEKCLKETLHTVHLQV